MINYPNFKSKEEKLTQKRVEMAMQYIVYCYQKMIQEQKKYQKTEFLNSKGKRLNLEEGLSEKLVNEYLGVWENLDYYKNCISDKPGVHLFFNNETKQSYTDDGVVKDDFIDIKIQDTELSNIWGSSGIPQQIHIALECKVVENGYSQYVSDIIKMSSRPFNTPRLQFEGQIAYITNSKYSHSKVVSGVNKHLETNTQIVTIQQLTQNKICIDFDACYLSIHRRIHSNQANFTIYHLLLDYTSIVVD